MGCKREWNREFIDIHLTQTFRTGPLRKHRQKCLIDSERARLPSLQVFVEATRAVERTSEQLLALSTRRMALKKERTALQNLLADAKIDPKDYKTQMRPLSKEIVALKLEIAVLMREKWNANEILTGRKAPEARQFIMKCPAEDCRGFLSSAWKCGTCEKNFCADCHVEKKGRSDDTHVCNEEAKATAQMIKKETKPCPKCGIRISKIDGCDQMWCTGCHTTFSWHTGQAIVNARVHNPHYYEYLRRVHNGVIPREAGDNPCGENNLPDYYNFVRFVMDEIPGLQPQEKAQLTNIHRALVDIQDMRFRDYPIEDTRDLTKDVNIRFLMQRLTEEDWGRSLQMIADGKEKKKEVGLILRMLHQVGTETFRALYQLRTGPLTIAEWTTHTERPTAAKQALAELETLRKYTNKSLLNKAVQMNMSIRLLDDAWFWRVLNASEAKKEYAESAKAVAS
jgi:hypothetical protein